MLTFALLLTALLACGGGDADATTAGAIGTGACTYVCNRNCVHASEVDNVSCTDTGMTCTAACTPGVQTCMELEDGSCGWVTEDQAAWEQCWTDCGATAP